MAVGADDRAQPQEVRPGPKPAFEVREGQRAGQALDDERHLLGRSPLQAQARRRGIVERVRSAEADPLPVEGLQRPQAQAGSGEHTLEAVGLQEILHPIDGDPKPRPHRRALLQPHAHDADHAPVLVQHRPSAAARIDGRVGLDVARVALAPGAEGADRPPADRRLRQRIGGHRLSDLHRPPERETDRLHGLPRGQSIRIAEGREGQVRAAHGQDRDVEVGIARLHARLEPCALGRKGDLDPLDLDADAYGYSVALHRDVLAADHVVVRDHVSRRRDDEPAARRDLDLRRFDRLLPGALVLRAHDAEHPYEHGGAGRLRDGLAAGGARAGGQRED